MRPPRTSLSGFSPVAPPPSQRRPCGPLRHQGPRDHVCVDRRRRQDPRGRAVALRGLDHAAARDNRRLLVHDRLNRAPARPNRAPARPEQSTGPARSRRCRRPARAERAVWRRLFLGGLAVGLCHARFEGHDACSAPELSAVDAGDAALRHRED
eukprot:7384353-Prymnesium_polylepis.1